MPTLYAAMCTEAGQPTHLAIATSQEVLKKKLYDMYEISDNSFDELIATQSCIIKYDAQFGESLSLNKHVQVFLDTTEL